MATCPKGHESASTDYCDECGAPIGGTAGGAPAGAAATPTAAGEPCPECASPRSGRFCEVCGHDFLAAELDPAGAASGAGPAASAGPAGAAPPSTTPPSGEAGPATSAPSGEAGAPTGGVPGGWRVVVTADRAYYDRMRAAAEPGAQDVPFPAFCPERRFGLRSAQVLIGRQSRSRGIEPDIDLTGPPEDPAVSHAHAVLVTQPGGGWAVVDLGSANGTYVNDGATAIEENLPVPVADGDRIHVGAWSTLTLRAS